MLRPAGVPTPCHKCVKVPLEAREAGLDTPTLRALAVDPTDQSRDAFEFYQECRAVGHFPNDPIVRWCARIIREVEDLASRQPFEQLEKTLHLLTTKLREW